MLTLSTELARRDWPVEVATPGDSAIAPALEQAGIPVHRIEMTRAPGPGDLRAARELRALEAAGDYAIVHAHSSKAGALARAALPRARRIVYTPHCFSFAAAFGRGQRLLYTAAEQALVPRTGRIVAVCEWERDRGRDRLRGANSRMSVVLNGVPPCGDPAPHPDLVAWADGQPLAGMVAVLRPQKDPLTLVRAAERVDPALGRIAIVGEGELADAVRAEIDARGIGDRVRLFPFGGDVGPYLSALDLFVLPSAWEALPIAVLEAMACGVPVVATRVGGVPEAVDDGRTGTLVAAGDDVAMAEAIEALLSAPERRAEYGAEARRVAATRFSVEGMVDATADVYERLLP